MGLLIVNDAQMTKQAFLLPKDSNSITDEMYKYQFTPYSINNVDDTTVGGNWVINPPAQMTRWADIKERRRVRMPGSSGMGRVYSESINTHKEVVTFRWGKPRFVGLTTFFTDFYDANMTTMVRSGREPGILYSASRAVATIFAYMTPLPYLYMAGRVLRYMLGKPTSQYWYMVPTMHMFWSTFQTLVNNASVNFGLTAGLTAGSPGDANSSQYKSEGGVVKSQFHMGDSDRAEFQRLTNALLPDVYRQGTGGFDIYQIATRRQRIQQTWNAKMYELMKDQGVTSIDTFSNRLNAALSNTSDFPADVLIKNNYQDYLEKYSQNDMYSAKWDDHSIQLEDMTIGGGAANTTTGSNISAGLNGQTISATPDSTPPTPIGGDTSSTSSSSTDNNATENSLMTLLNAELADGAQFISYKVDHISTIGESFSNSAAESEIASTLNAKASANISRRFSFAGGTIDGGVLDGIKNSVMDVANGVLDGLGIDGIVGAVLGSAYADIPKYWSGSSANLPHTDMTIELRAPYGNRFSIFTNLIIPLMGLLAGALPQMNGKASYGSPFLCECYVPGKMQIKLGMIDSINITRGVGNVGWTMENLPLGIDVTFSVVDLSSVMAMPVTTGSASLSDLDPRTFVSDLLADETPLNNYLATLAALTVTEQTYMMPDLARRWRKKMTNIDSFWSKGNFANWVSDTMPGRMASALLWQRTDRPY